MPLSEEEKWNAIVNCDNSYDGSFYYAVKTTGIFCRPSCKSRTPAQQNVGFFDKREEAIASGFRPCKRCRPDLIDFRPVEDIAQQTKELVERCFTQGDWLIEEIRNLGVTSNHLTVIFRKQYGVTPLEYRNQLQAQLACKLLAETDDPIIHVMEACGFNSLSAFYEFFKKQTGTTPKEYRNKAKDDVK